MTVLSIIATLSFLMTQLFYFGDFTPHIPIVLGLAVTATVGWFHGFKWSDIQDGIFHVIDVVLP